MYTQYIHTHKGGICIHNTFIHKMVRVYTIHRYTQRYMHIQYTHNYTDKTVRSSNKKQMHTDVHTQRGNFVGREESNKRGKEEGISQ